MIEGASNAEMPTHNRCSCRCVKPCPVEGFVSNTEKVVGVDEPLVAVRAVVLRATVGLGWTV